MEGLTTHETAAVTDTLEVIEHTGAGAPNQRRVLIVERDSESVANLKLKLSQAGFKVTISLQGEDARLAVDRDEPHLIMMDWDLPAMIAMDLVRHIRGRAAARGPRLIALSSFGSEQHVVSGFDLGVDDYVIKPFSVPEVVARVRAVLRPMRTAAEDSSYFEFRELRVDSNDSRVTVLDRTVALRKMEFQLLLFLVRRAERAFSRETLLQQVWGSQSQAGVRAVDVTIQRIRRALAPHDCDRYLQTIRGMGYRLSVDVGHT